MTSSGRPEHAPRHTSALWIGTVVLAAAAAAVMVLSDDSRVLKLGLVAALWAALLGAFAVAKLRAKVAAEAERSDERQRIYELELEREIAARREFEAEAEADARRKAVEQSDTEIQALKAELQSLRENLEKVLGGDVLFERVALRAESTRLRSLAEHGGTGNQPRVIQHGDGRGKLSTGVQGQVDPHVGEQQPPRQPRPRKSRPQQGRPAPRQPEPRKPRNVAQGAWPAQQPQPPIQRPREHPASRTGEIPVNGGTDVQEALAGNPAATGRAAAHQPAPAAGAQGTGGHPQQAGVGNPAMTAEQPAVQPKSAAAPESSPASTQDRAAAPQNSAPPAQHHSGPPETSAAAPGNPAGAPAKPQQPAEPQAAEPSNAAGAHTEGTSVTDLLAAYGDSRGSASKRRRRRSD